MTKTITTNIINDGMDTYDRVLDTVTIYAEEWSEDGTVVLTVNAEEYDEEFAEEE